MKKLISYRKAFLIICAVLTVISLAVYFIFGNDSDKISVAVMMMVYPLVIFAFFRFAFYMWTKKKFYKTVIFFSWFLLLGGAFFAIGGVIMMIVNFPNVAAPPLSIGMSMILCVLYSNAKLTETSDT